MWFFIGYFPFSWSATINLRQYSDEISWRCKHQNFIAFSANFVLNMIFYIYKMQNIICSRVTWGAKLQFVFVVPLTLFSRLNNSPLDGWTRRQDKRILSSINIETNGSFSRAFKIFAALYFKYKCIRAFGVLI